MNKALSEDLDTLADLLEISGANRFRINSIRRAARTIKDLIDDVSDLVESGDIEGLPGIGKGIAQRIADYVSDGHLLELQQLKVDMPEGLPTLLQIPGMGPKKVSVVWKELGVTDVAGLKQAIASGALAELSGFGPQSAKKISEGISFLEQSGNRVAHGLIRELAARLADQVRHLAGVRNVEIAGSLRRGRDTIRDIDLLCTADDGEAVINDFVLVEDIQDVIAKGATKATVTVLLADQAVQVDLRVVPESSFGAALQYFTGSKAHNVRLRERAIKQGLKLNEWGLFKGQDQVAGASEADVYSTLGLPHIPPELREDQGELELDNRVLAALVTLEDIRGDLHMHTTASDGKCSLQEMAAAAQARGYEYINITDHSKSSAIANGLSIERMQQQLELVRTFDREHPEINVLVGCECDILANGELDYPDEILAQCDLVVASIHNAQGQDRHTITARTIKAVEHPYVHILGHPTGRLINRRAPSALDVSEVVRAAVASGTALEINAAWKRLDLCDRHVRMAVEAGAWISINTDSHHTDQLSQMNMGIMTARRGGVPTERVINTLSLNELLAWKRRVANS